MASEKLLRIPKSGDPREFVLVNVIGAGKEDLDLNLVATEGESPYVLSVRHRTINKLEGRKTTIPADQWAQILTFALLCKSPDPSSSDDFRKGFEVVADTEEDHLKLIFRQRIGELTQGFGSLSLKQDDDQAIELFDWAGRAVARSTNLEEDISSLQVKYEAAIASIEKLNAQLEDLTVAKKKHEEEILAKCVLLLNEKKLKVRNQQRLVASAKVDPAKVKQLDETRTGRGRRSPPELTGASKRKATSGPQDSESEESGFEQMEVDGKARVVRSDSEGVDAETPERSDADTTGDEEEDIPDPKPVSRATRSHDVPTSKNGKEASPPPVRELPFSKKASGSHEPDNDDDTEGETDDDDEL